MAVDDRYGSIQDIDERILELLQARVARLKLDDELNGFAEVPESELLQDYASTLGASVSELSQLCWHFHSLSLRLTQDQKAIGFLGPDYSYSYLAAVKYFGMSANLRPVATIADGFDLVERGQVEFAVVPIENSTDGRIVESLGKFSSSPVKICGEVLMPIHHCLLATCTREEITRVVSKPEALSQCREWLEHNLPAAKTESCKSTADAARMAAETKGVAAIASAEAGVHYGLQLVDAKIEDNVHNLTRFFVIGNMQKPTSGNDKTALRFQLEHRPGSLASAMILFHEADINMTWIESFPLHNKPSEYLFFVELEGHQEDASVASAIEKLRKESRELHILGSYPRSAQHD
ncbi:MAG: prephenate dehydratase [Planctomycetota bacterium]